MEKFESKKKKNAHHLHPEGPALIRLIAFIIAEIERRSTLNNAYYDICPHCGANLDPGETCDCSQTAHVPQVPLTAEEIKPGDKVAFIGGTMAARRNPSRYPGFGTVGTVTLIAQVGTLGKDIYVRWPRNGGPTLLYPVQAPMLARAE